MAGAGDLLVHVRTRLDALTYDAHSQYLLSSLQASPYVETSSSSRLVTSWTRCLGLTGFYVRLIFLLGTGWLLAMVGIFTFLSALPAAQEDIVISSTAQVILLLAVYFLGGAAGAIIFGIFADHFGRRPVLLSALAFWLVVNALTAAAWDYRSFVSLRLLAGAGIGGQLPLLATISLEYTPTRTRGRITALTVSVGGIGVFGGVGYGQLASSALGEGGLGWRVTYGVLSAIGVLFLAVLYLALEESPKYLASVGRAQEALKLLEKIESQHGINRQARVTVPTSLYEPPSQRPQVSYERYPEEGSSSESDFEMELEANRRRRRDGDYDDEIPAYASFQASRSNMSLTMVGPGAVNARIRSQRASARRQSRHQLEVYPRASELDVPTDELAPVAGVSFLRSLCRRVAVLLSGRLAMKTAFCWFFWFAQFTSLSAAIVTMLMMAGTFIKVNAIGTGFSVGDQLFWSSMVFPGLLVAALVLETVGRRATLAMFAFCDGLVTISAALLLEEDGEWTGISLALGAMVLMTGGTIGSMIAYTGEQFPLLTRALGISCAAAWGHLGMFAGVYLVLRRVMGDAAWTWHDERVMLAVCGGVSLMLIPVVLLMGSETRGRDIDAPWYGGNKAMQVLRAGEPFADSPRPRGPSKGNRPSRPKEFEKFDRINESSEDDQGVPRSPFGRDPRPGPGFYSPASAAMMHSPADSSSSSSSSGFWQSHSVRHLGRKVKRAIARDDKPGAGFKLQGRCVSVDAKRARGGTVNIDDRCDTLPMDDLDQLDLMVTEHEYHNHSSSDDRRRHSVLEMLEPVLLDWRRSLSSSFSGSARDLSGSSKASRPSKPEHSATAPTDVESATAASDIRSSESGRYTIDLDMFDTFTYISTPVLGGDNYTHEPREPSNLSSNSSRGDVK